MGNTNFISRQNAISIVLPLSLLVLLVIRHIDAQWDLCIAHGFLLAVVFRASYTDQHTQRIRNSLTYGGFVGAVALSCLQAGLGFHWRASTETSLVLASCSPSESFVGGSCCFGLMLAIYLTKGIGAGDVKLASVIGAVLGVRLGISVLLTSHALAGIASVATTLWRFGFKPTIGGLPRIMRVWLPAWLVVSLPPFGVRTSDDAEVFRRRIPMGVHFAIGTLFAVFVGGVL